MRKFLLMVIMALTAVQAFSQTVVNGRVMDKTTGEAEVGAVVQVFSGDPAEGHTEGYAVTDTAGVFSIKTRHDLSGDKARGGYFVQVVNMGRKSVNIPFEVDASVVEIGAIGLEDDVESLSGSTVTALKTLVRIDADKLTYDVEADADSKTMTVLEMLRKIPMVTVDAQDKISVNGSSSFKVYVDGRPNPMLSTNASQIFKLMPANNIKSIEVITNPGAKYDAEGTGGVLDIKTKSGSSKDAVSDGIYGTVSLGSDIRLYDTPIGTQAGLSLNAQKGKWTVGTNINAALEPYNGVRVEQAQMFKDGSHLNTDCFGDADQKMIMGELSLSYELDTLNLFTASAGYNGFSNRSTTYDLLIAKYASDDTQEYSYEGSSVSDMHWNEIEASANYQHRFAGSTDKLLTLSYQFSGCPTVSDSENKMYNMVGITLPDPERITSNDDGSYENTFQADYTTPLWAEGHNLSTGLKYIYRNNTAYDVYNGVESNYKYNNNIGAVYAEYAGSFGHFVVKTGLRFEQTWLKVNYITSPEKNFKSCYPAFVPNASLQYNLGMTSNVSLSYNMRIRRPGIEYLNPFVDKSNPTSLSFGNPDIQSEQSHRLQLAYNFASPKWVLSLRLSESIGDKGIAGYTYYDDAQKLLINTYGNVSSSNRTSLNVYVNWNASNKTRLYVFGDAGYMHLKGYAKVDDKVVLDLTNGGFQINGGFGFQHTFPWDLRFSLNTYASSRQYSLQGYQYGMGFGTAGLTKSFLDDRLSLSMHFMTNLNKGRLVAGSYSKGDTFDAISKQHIPLRAVGFAVSYTFGKKVVRLKQTERSINNDDLVGGKSTGGSINVNKGAGM